MKIKCILLLLCICTAVAAQDSLRHHHAEDSTAKKVSYGMPAIATRWLTLIRISTTTMCLARSSESVLVV